MIRQIISVTLSEYGYTALLAKDGVDPDFKDKDGRTPLSLAAARRREAVVKLLDGVREAGESELAALREKVRTSAAVCADETGWRQNGDNGYLWGFFTAGERYFEYRKSRAALVPEEILGEDFGGTITCDFYAAYNKLGVLQRCWFHLLKDARELAEINADRPQVGEWVEEMC